MPDIVEVGSQIKIEDPRFPLHNRFSHSLDHVVCCPLGPISIRPRLEVRLEHRFEDELERTLHHSVPNRRDRQDADFAPVFRYLLLAGWERRVGAPGQFVAQLLEQSLHALRLDGRETICSAARERPLTWHSTFSGSMAPTFDLCRSVSVADGCRPFCPQRDRRSPRRYPSMGFGIKVGPVV